jgi:hypothetical protein
MRLPNRRNDTVIDDHIVALDENGRPSFNRLQGFGSAQAIVLYAFDLLMLRGKDVRLRSLEDRREQLRETVLTLPGRSNPLFGSDMTGVLYSKRDVIWRVLASRKTWSLTQWSGWLNLFHCGLITPRQLMLYARRPSRSLWRWKGQIRR